MEGEQTGWVIQQNVRNEAVQVHVNEGQVVRTCSRTDLGIFHFKCFKFGCHTHVNAGIVVRTLSRTDLAWRIPSQIWLSQIFTLSDDFTNAIYSQNRNVYPILV